MLAAALLASAIAAPALGQTEAAMEKSLLPHLSLIARSAGQTELLERENRLLKQKLLRFAKTGASQRYAFRGLAGKMYVASSKDGKFRIYSWDTNKGGTMKFFDGVYQYKTKRGRVNAKPFQQTQEFSARGFYSQIFQLDAGGKTYYLANSNNILSNASMHQDLEMYSIEGEKLNDDVRLIRTTTAFRNSVGFDYDFFSVVDRKERPVKLFWWDEGKKEFRFPVVLKDDKFPNGGRVTNRFITYRFNGKYFVRMGQR
jgi:hypothetical protein